MKKLAMLLIGAMVIMTMSCATTGSLPEFGAEMGMQSNPIPNQPAIRVPYSSMVSYYGYVQPGVEPDEVVNGKKMYYLYVWIPIVAPELGIRMVSPVPEGYEPAETDFVAETYEANKDDTTNYFDTWISWERAVEILSPEDIATNGETTDWLRFDYNDDSSELPANPSGSTYNSLLRIVSEVSDPLRSLIRGVYRIGFTTFKVGEVQGSFLAQVGAPVDIPGVVIAPSLDELLAGIQAAEGAE